MNKFLIIKIKIDWDNARNSRKDTHLFQKIYFSKKYFDARGGGA